MFQLGVHFSGSSTKMRFGIAILGASEEQQRRMSLRRPTLESPTLDLSCQTISIFAEHSWFRALWAMNWRVGNPPAVAPKVRRHYSGFNKRRLLYVVWEARPE